MQFQSLRLEAQKRGMSLRRAVDRHGDLVYVLSSEREQPMCAAQSLRRIAVVLEAARAGRPADDTRPPESRGARKRRKRSGQF